MPQFARPVETLVNQFDFEPFGIPFGDVPVPLSLHKAVNEEVNDSTETIVKTRNPVPLNTTDKIIFRLAGINKDKKAVALTNPRSAADHILRVAVALDSADNNTPYPIRLTMKIGGVPNVSFQGTFSSAIQTYPNFSIINITKTKFPVNSALDYSILEATIEIKNPFFNVNQTSGAANTGGVWISWVQFECPDAVFQVTVPVDIQAVVPPDVQTTSVDHRTLMRAAATESLKRTRDERVTWDVTVTPASALNYSLKHKISAGNLRRWSDLNLQVMSLSLDFTENTIALRCSNDIFEEIGYRAVRSRLIGHGERSRLNMLSRQIKSRNNVGKRTRPYEDSTSLASGGLNARKDYFINPPVSDGLRRREDEATRVFV